MALDRREMRDASVRIAAMSAGLAFVEDGWRAFHVEVPVSSDADVSLSVYESVLTDYEGDVHLRFYYGKSLRVKGVRTQ